MSRGLLLHDQRAVTDGVSGGHVERLHSADIVGDVLRLLGGLLWRVNGPHLIHLQRPLQRGLLLPLRVDVRDAIHVPGRPLLPVGNVLGGAVPLPRGHVLARRRGLHGAGLVRSVPGRHVRQCDGAHDLCVHRRVSDWLLLPPGLDLRDADHLPRGLLLPRWRRRGDALLVPVRVLGHGPDL